jgi:hypothetical protein
MNKIVLLVSTKDMPSALAALECADRTDLIERWCSLIGSPPPKNLSVPFLRRALAFELQCQVHGSAKARKIEDLGRMAVGGASHSSVGAKLRQGTKLVREWQGRTWTVEVIDGGFIMAGERFASLSAIARKITGARWSGPRFFGLTEKSSPDGAAARTLVQEKAA